MENKSRSVNYFEIVKIDVLETRDYVDRVPDVNLFLLAKGTSISECFFYENTKNPFKICMVSAKTCMISAKICMISWKINPLTWKNKSWRGVPFHTF